MVKVKASTTERTRARRGAPSRPRPARPSRTAERRQALKTALTDAAERAIAADGLAGLNARALAAEVGCALGAIYNVFPDLDAIVYEVNARTLARFEAFVAKQQQAAGAHAGGDAAGQLIELAVAYLDFAAANRPRWQALFAHRAAAFGAPLPQWYLADQDRMFGLVEGPLAALRPDLGESERRLFARTMFSAVHGIVSLGLDEKLMSLPVAVIADQVRSFVAALANGLAAGRG